MLLLVLGLALWVAAHGLKVHAPTLRAQMAAQAGEGTVKALTALVLLGSVVLMVKGYQQADYVALWTPPGWTTHLNNTLMILALLVYGAGAVRGHLRAWIRHPQLTAVKIWAVAHLLVNGHLAAVVLFGTLLLWAVAALVGINKRDGKGPKPEPGPWRNDALHVVASVVLFVAVAWVHNYLGVWPFPGAPPV